MFSYIIFAHTIQSHTIWGLFSSIFRATEPLLQSNLRFSIFSPLLDSSNFLAVPLWNDMTERLHEIFLTNFTQFTLSIHTSQYSFLSRQFQILKLKVKTILPSMIWKSFSDGANIQSPCIIIQPWIETCQYLKKARLRCKERGFILPLFLRQVHMQKKLPTPIKSISFDTKPPHSVATLPYTGVYSSLTHSLQSLHIIILLQVQLHGVCH